MQPYPPPDAQRQPPVQRVLYPYAAASPSQPTQSAVRNVEQYQHAGRSLFGFFSSTPTPMRNSAVRNVQLPDTGFAGVSLGHGRFAESLGSPAIHPAMMQPPAVYLPPIIPSGPAMMSVPVAELQLLREAYQRSLVSNVALPVSSPVAAPVAQAESVGTVAVQAPAAPAVQAPVHSSVHKRLAYRPDRWTDADANGSRKPSVFIADYEAYCRAENADPSLFFQTFISGVARDSWFDSFVEGYRAEHSTSDLPPWTAMKTSFLMLQGDDLRDRTKVSMRHLFGSDAERLKMSKGQSVIHYITAFRTAMLVNGPDSVKPAVAVNLFVQGLTDDLKRVAAVDRTTNKDYATLQAAYDGVIGAERLTNSVALRAAPMLAQGSMAAPMQSGHSQAHAPGAFGQPSYQRPSFQQQEGMPRVYQNFSPYGTEYFTYEPPVSQQSVSPGFGGMSHQHMAAPMRAFGNNHGAASTQPSSRAPSVAGDAKPVGRRPLICHNCFQPGHASPSCQNAKAEPPHDLDPALLPSWHPRSPRYKLGVRQGGVQAPRSHGQHSHGRDGSRGVYDGRGVRSARHAQGTGSSRDQPDA